MIATSCPEPGSRGPAGPFLKSSIGAVPGRPAEVVCDKSSKFGSGRLAEVVYFFRFALRAIGISSVSHRASVSVSHRYLIGIGI